MGIPASDDEKVIVSAFLQSGHPWMAFGTVMLKSGVRVTIATALMFLALEQGNNVPSVLKLLGTSL
ncbi:hypothetical protein [Oleomonas cavernae]|uniref:hypothetical protein n=1 Tax=Oleomonas cavernae TaxID=2320859 RepID=UPI0011C4185D|nr:hypothetical protein [Oleomonas cavernae]